MFKLKSRGITLLELLVAMGILMTLSIFSVLSFMNMVQSTQAKALIRTLASDIELARSLAIETRQPVTLCLTRNQKTCTLQPSQAYLIISTALKADQETPFFYQAVPLHYGHLQWKGFNTAQSIQFQYNGETQHQNGRFIYCSTNKKYAAGLTINQHGRVSILDDQSARDC